MKRNLLLISNSTLYGSSYLDHCSNDISNFLKYQKKILFIPYARPGGISFEEYSNIAKKRFKKMGYDLTGIHDFENPYQAIKENNALFIGGGNTFVLLNSLYSYNLINIIKQRVSEGMFYIGTSAGSNVAGNNIMTTNDMPIIYPPSFQAINLVNFNINPHFIDPDPNIKHMGETREMRIKEFLAYNKEFVVALREGSMLYVKNNKIILNGKNGARIFKDYKDTLEAKSGDNISFLLD
jgi:dipeptidase E